MTENLGKSDYEEEIRRRTKTIFVPNWFSVDLKVGVSRFLIEIGRERFDLLNFIQILTITLEESDVFAAWIAVKEIVDNSAAGNTETVDLKGTKITLF